MNDGHKHIKLVLRSLPSGQNSVVCVQKATAEFLGWTNHFPTYTEWVEQQRAGGNPIALSFRKHEPRTQMGKPIRIGRGKDSRRNEAGLTHTFRIGSKVSIRDLAELAHFTEVDWEWMERPNRCRETREWWSWQYATTP